MAVEALKLRFRKERKNGEIEKISGRLRGKAFSLASQLPPRALNFLSPGFVHFILIIKEAASAEQRAALKLSLKLNLHAVRILGKIGKQRVPPERIICNAPKISNG